MTAGILIKIGQRQVRNACLFYIPILTRNDKKIGKLLIFALFY